MAEFWNKNSIEKLIEIYENISIKLFVNNENVVKNKKVCSTKLYDEVVVEFRQIYNNISPSDVIKKLKYLNEHFCRLQNRINASICTEAGAVDVFKPKWPYFQKISKIRNIIDGDRNTTLSNINIKTSTTQNNDQKLIAILQDIENLVEKNNKFYGRWEFILNQIQQTLEKIPEQSQKEAEFIAFKFMKELQDKCIKKPPPATKIAMLPPLHWYKLKQQQQQQQKFLTQQQLQQLQQRQHILPTTTTTIPKQLVLPNGQIITTTQILTNTGPPQLAQIITMNPTTAKTTSKARATVVSQQFTPQDDDDDDDDDNIEEIMEEEMLEDDDNDDSVIHVMDGDYICEEDDDENDDDDDGGDGDGSDDIHQQHHHLIEDDQQGNVDLQQYTVMERGDDDTGFCEAVNEVLQDTNSTLDMQQSD